VRLTDPVLALDFDLAAAARLLALQRAAEAEPGIEDSALGSTEATHLRW
jgi:hypothetical protein